MDTYHFHLVFDIASFVGVSNTAALVCWRFCLAKLGEFPGMKNRNGRKRISLRTCLTEDRYRGTLIFLILYLALLIVLEIRLSQWSPDTEPGRCYYSHLVTSPSASHPTSDMTYVGVTGFWLILIVLAGMFAGVQRRRAILILSMLHFPLHLYMTIVLRQANQGKFEGETKHEHEWDFGQTTAVILLGIAVVELIKKGREYYNFERQVAKNGIPLPTRDQSLEEVESATKNGYVLDDTRLKNEQISQKQLAATNEHSAN
ncbi:hypothetical protein N7462_003095 [Penicillium macrosclerotiorum]|uniref:uncharacterized protein n=1 Tax=Penicillium macrosclerotiorum TaxID=303699 RepID=UPI0025495C9A|nr:uncharacterized protein N7462_003095 [Penicillium macrosclerotiorum]KAJ5688703.1 hypothetical protein N7462_003095 [Penicillium macrosclerotiorum]